MDLNQVQSLYDPSIPPCYVVNITTGHGLFQSENPLSTAVPLLALQMALVIFINHALFHIMHYSYIPRIVADILGGILLGPSLLSSDLLTSKWPFVSDTFSLRTLIPIETIAYWALTCHMFLVGLETDVYSILRIGRKAMKVAAISVTIPFALGIALFFLPVGKNPSSLDSAAKTVGCLFFGSALAVTGFPTVARTLADLKLVHTDMGRMAMSTALASDLVTWLLLTVLLPFQRTATDLNKTGSKFVPASAFFAVTLTVGFGVFCFYVVRPVLAFGIRRTAPENKFNEYYLCFMLVLVSVFACVSEIFGTNSITGAFIFGLIMPNRVLANEIIEKFEDMISRYMLPLFFAAFGKRVNLYAHIKWGYGLIVVILAFMVKTASTLVASNVFEMPRKMSTTLGLLLNTKGILAIFILIIGLDKGVLEMEQYTIMAISILLMTAASGPLLYVIYRPSKRLSHYKQRTIQNASPDDAFRILACFHTSRNVTGIINLIDSSNATQESPLSIVAVHLIELSGRGSAMVIAHYAGGSIRRSRKNPESDQIINALETYAELSDQVRIQPLSIVSQTDTMHENICSLAEDHRTYFLILPFHKPPSQDGNIDEEAGNTALRGVTINVSQSAPCTVGIFVDRGYGETTQGDSNLRTKQIAMLFIGGPDDREALAYAWRMSGSHGISLTVIRFLPGDNIEEIERADLPAGDTQRLLTSASYIDKQRRLDNEYVQEFRDYTEGEKFISYHEKVVNNDEEMVSAIKEMNHSYDLYIVGKGEGIISPLTAGLLDWCEYPELGALGDLLVTSSFTQGSVLVMQQYSGDGEKEIEAMLTMPTPSTNGREHFQNWQRTMAEEDDGLESGRFVNRRSGSDHYE